MNVESVIAPLLYPAVRMATAVCARAARSTLRTSVVVAVTAPVESRKVNTMPPVPPVLGATYGPATGWSAVHTGERNGTQS